MSPQLLAPLLLSVHCMCNDTLVSGSSSPMRTCATRTRRSLPSHGSSALQCYKISLTLNTAHQFGQRTLFENANVYQNLDRLRSYLKVSF